MLSLNRTSLYYQKQPIPDKKLRVMHAIDEIYTEFPAYGSRHMEKALERRGLSVCRRTVADYMRTMGLEAIYPKPRLSQAHPGHKVYPYLLRNLPAEFPNHIWGTDITYIRMKRGFMYLVAFLDWYSRYVISWELSDSLAEDFVMDALKAALRTATPHIANSDQGSQFTGRAYIEELLANNVRISMDGRGRAMDNIFTERLWRTVKYEDVYIKEYSSPRELRSGLTDYFSKYNYKRLHQSLGYKTPSEIYFI
jgi:putative transposase